MMRGVANWSVAVRRPDGTISVQHFPLVSFMKRYPIFKLPVLRGMAALGESLALGVRSLHIAANEVMPEEEHPLTRRDMIVTLLIALVAAVILFFLLPLGLTGLAKSLLGEGILFWIVEGLVRIAIFVLYIVAITRIPDLRRVFEYHGAEHMSIHALEHDEPLDPGHVQKYSTLHVRCGTSFLLVVMVISIIVFALVHWQVWWVLILSRIVLVPLIAGLSYEVVKLAGRHDDNPLVKAIMAPGLALQWLTTRRPDKAQIEVAIAALEKILELEPQDQPPEKGAEVMA